MNLNYNYNYGNSDGQNVDCKHASELNMAEEKEKTNLAKCMALDLALATNKLS